MTEVSTTGRPNQRRRTRKDLLQAAARLMKQGRKPSLEEVAEEALVSRATAYRYFPSVEELLVEASLDVATPDVEDVLGDDRTADPVVRLEKVDAAMQDFILENEASLRLMLSAALTRNMSGAPTGGGAPARQNRRGVLIDAALEPAKAEFKPGDLKMLSRALALVIGSEAMVVTKDVLQLSDAEARKVKRFAIRALIEAARK